MSIELKRKKNKLYRVLWSSPYSLNLGTSQKDFHNLCQALELFNALRVENAPMLVKLMDEPAVSAVVDDRQCVIPFVFEDEID